MDTTRPELGPETQQAHNLEPEPGLEIPNFCVGTSGNLPIDNLGNFSLLDRFSL